MHIVAHSYIWIFQRSFATVLKYLNKSHKQEGIGLQKLHYLVMLCKTVGTFLERRLA